VIRLSLIYDRIRWEEKALAKAAEDEGLDVSMVDAKAMFLDTEWSRSRTKKEFGDIVLQRCISYFRGLHSTAFLESKGVKVINGMDVSLTCGNKLLTTLKLDKAGVPTPRTLLSFTEGGALKSLEALGYPAVLKPVIGSWGRLIVQLKDREMAQAIFEARAQMNGPLNQIFYIQDMVKRPPRDIRTIVAGDEIIAAVYRYAPAGEWRTNIAVGGRAEVCPVTEELEGVVLKAAETVGGGLLGIDAMESPRGILVHEVNNTVEFKGAASVANTDIAAKIVKYIKKQIRG